MKEFFMKKGIRILALVLVVAVIVAVSASLLGGRAGFLSNASGAMTAPVKSAATAVVTWFEGIYGYLYEYDQLVAENAELHAQLAKAQEEARLASEALEENDRLRELAGLKEKHSDFVTETSRIVEWNPSNWASSFTISKGENYGIEVGNCVVTEYGALVGQVAELGDTWATVRTVVDVEMNIGALVGEAGNAAMIVGDFSLMKKGSAKLTHLTEGTQLFEGDAILTSGKGGMFPPGLLIGYVLDIETEAGGQMPYAIVEPACKLDSLAHVVVIKEFDVVE